MSPWSANGPERGEADGLDDLTAEELLEGRYEGDAADLVAVSQFLEYLGSLADGLSPWLSAALVQLVEVSVKSQAVVSRVIQVWALARREHPRGAPRRTSEAGRVRSGPDPP